MTGLHAVFVFFVPVVGTCLVFCLFIKVSGTATPKWSSECRTHKPDQNLRLDAEEPPLLPSVTEIKTSSSEDAASRQAGASPSDVGTSEDQDRKEITMR